MKKNESLCPRRIWAKLLTRCAAVFLVIVAAMACQENDEPVIPPPPTINLVDSLVMIDLYHSMDGEQWADKYQWDLTDPETWLGIHFALNESGLKVVEKIQLRNEQTASSCSIPESIGQLKHLRAFEITHAPRLYGKIPESIFNCPIEHFSVSGSPFLSGPLSPKIANWRNTLKFFYLGHCLGFTSTIPVEMGECTEASILIWYCNLIGSVPIELKNLKHCPDFKGNHLTGIDWRFFTEEGTLPQASYNDFLTKVPEEVIATPKWEEYAYFVFCPFNEGYGFSNVTINR